MISNVKEARSIAEEWKKLYLWEVAEAINFGLPEVDDRYNLCRIPIVLVQSSDGVRF